MVYHKSVLINEVLKFLDVQPNKLYVDATFGGGGHTRKILESNPTCKVIAVDWDKKALEINGEGLKEEFGERLTLAWGNFAFLINVLKKVGIKKVDGILADFGTSQFQIMEGEGFSVYQDTFLDMRMSPAHHKLTAYEIINTYQKDQLERIFFDLGEERYSKQIVKAIIDRRRQKKIETTKQLAEVVEKAVPFSRKSKVHPATRIFQALRILVNKELENIHSFLSSSLQLLNPGGRLVCISFHSLEDRIVKEFLRDNQCIEGVKGFKILTPKVILPTETEIKENPSSRSAKLRAAEVCQL